MNESKDKEGHGKSESQVRYFRWLQTLRNHHDACVTRQEEWLTKETHKNFEITSLPQVSNPRKDDMSTSEGSQDEYVPDHTKSSTDSEDDDSSAHQKQPHRKNLDQINIDPQEGVMEDTEASDDETDPISAPDWSSSKSPGTRKRREPALQNLQPGSEDHIPGFSSKSPGQTGGKGLQTRTPTEEMSTSTGSKGKKRPWTVQEVNAVEETLMDNIQSGKVPGKAQCIQCIEESAGALQTRTWEGVKFYVKNRIEAGRRQSCKRK